MRKSLTPTNEHPLQNLSKVYNNDEGIYDSDEDYELEKPKKQNDENKNDINKSTNNCIDDNQNQISRQNNALPAPVNNVVGSSDTTKTESSSNKIPKLPNKSEAQNQESEFFTNTKKNKAVIENEGFESDVMERLDGNLKQWL